MSSQSSECGTPEDVSLSTPRSACNGTPNARGSGSARSGCMSSSSWEGESTPNQTPVRNKVLTNLINGRMSSKSPMLKIPASPMLERLGYGTGGVGVFLLQRSPRPGGELCSPWALKKTVKVEEESDLYAARIEYEAEILKKLSHPNIIGYRAFGKPSPDGVYLAMERAGKSLADLIEDRIEEVMVIENCDAAAPFPALKMEKVALDVAKALTYLHDEVKMVHGDLKSANVLVIGDFETIKLCDFGVARKLAKDGTVEGAYVGTEIWNPMEVAMAKKGQKTVPITHKADIYAFGLTIHEMITLKPPHLSSAEDSYLETENSFNDNDLSKENDSFEESFDDNRYEDALTRYIGTRPPLPDIKFDSSYNNILRIFGCCTDEDPSKRPDAKDIILEIKTHAQSPPE